MTEELLSADKDRLLALGFSVVIAAGEARQITFNGIMPFDMPVAVRNAMLDQVMALGDRQRARYDIEGIDDDLQKHRDALSQMAEDRERIEIEHGRIQARRRVELDERLAQRPAEQARVEAEINVEVLRIQRQRQAIAEEGHREFTQSGRRGAYRPEGVVKANLDRHDKALEDIAKRRDEDLAQAMQAYDDNTATAEAEITKAEEERKKHLDNMDASVKRYNEHIALQEAKRTKLLAQLEG